MEHHGAGKLLETRVQQIHHQHSSDPKLVLLLVLGLSLRIYPCYTFFPPKPLPPSCASHVGRFPWSWTWPFTQPHCHSCDAQIVKLKMLKGDWKPCLHDNSFLRLSQLRKQASLFKFEPETSSPRMVEWRILTNAFNFPRRPNRGLINCGKMRCNTMMHDMATSTSVKKANLHMNQHIIPRGNDPLRSSTIYTHRHIDVLL